MINAIVDARCWFEQLSKLLEVNPSINMTGLHLVPDMLMYFLVSPPLCSLDTCISYSPRGLLARIVRAQQPFGIAAIQIPSRVTVPVSSWNENLNDSMCT